MLDYLRSFGLFWYRFLIGDDWIGAAIILAGFAGTYLLVTRFDSYWLLPLSVLVSVTVSLYRAFRSESVKGGQSEQK